MKQDEAIAWLVRIQSDSADEAVWQEFTAWLEADEAHRAAFERVEAFDAQTLSDIRAVQAFAEAAPVVARRGIFARPGLAVTGLIALAACLVIAVAVVWQSSSAGPLSYQTEFGQTKTVSLSDGSTVELNTNTKIVVDSAQGNRRVALERGEALFHVAKDKAHPFVVAVGNRFVRVVGTVFNVLRDRGAIRVVVAEGKVMFSSHAMAGNEDEIALTPGDELVFDENGAKTRRSRVDPSHALAWRDGYLVYQNAALSEVVVDLNRYYANPIVLQHDGAAKVRFSGVLKIDNQNAVVARLSQFLPVAAARQPDGSVMLHLTKKRD